MIRVRLDSSLAVLALALGAVGCGAEFDPPHEVKTLRVLGVQKSAPYAQPGQDVELRMLWTDASPKAPRPVSVTWFSGCTNPPGDLYYNCFTQLGSLDPGSGSLPPGVKVGTGNRFTFTMPADVIDSRPPPQDPKLPPYGLAYVFFAVCAGQLGPAPSDQPFPIGCYGPDGKALGADDFIVGYSAIYAYRDFTNANPSVTGFSFNGVETPPVCIGEQCADVSEPPPPPDCSQPNVPCIFACAADGDEDDCDGYPVRPLVDRDSAEKDSVSSAAYGRDTEEQMWIRYFADAGSLDSDIRLLNDAEKGWNDDFGTKFRAPKDPGVVNLWAVVYDNRGGMNWVRQQVVVQ